MKSSTATSRAEVRATLLQQLLFLERETLLNVGQALTK